MRPPGPAIAAIAAVTLLAVVTFVVSQTGDDVQATGRAADAHPAIDGIPRPAQSAGSDLPAPDSSITAPPAGPAPSGSPEQRCIGLVNEAARFARTERDPSAPARTTLDDALWREATANLQRSLQRQSDPDHLLAAMLLGPTGVPQYDGPANIAALREFGHRATTADSPVLAWHALRACHEAGESCPIVHLEPMLIDTQPQNAEVWGLAATRRYQSGDVQGALAAMQAASRATTSSWHWPETIASIERALQTHTDMPYPDRVDTAFGIGAGAALPSQSRLTKMCDAESRRDRSWAESCLAFANLRVQHNETLLGQSIAHAMRERALQALGQQDRANEIAAEQKQRNAVRHAWHSHFQWSRGTLQQALLHGDPERLRGFLDGVRLFGEIPGTMEFLRREVPALLERAELLDHPAARECMAELIVDAPAG